MTTPVNAPINPESFGLIRDDIAALHSELRARLPLGPVLSVEDACRVLGCKRRRLFELLKTGDLERAPRNGRELRITKASIERRLQPVTPKGRKRRREPALFEPARLQDIPVFEG